MREAFLFVMVSDTADGLSCGQEKKIEDVWGRIAACDGRLKKF